MRRIADANVLLPLLTEGHAHHGPAAAWWDPLESLRASRSGMSPSGGRAGSCDDGDVGLSLPARMALLRLLSNTKVMGSSVRRPAAAWNAVQSLIDDPRIVTGS